MRLNVIILGNTSEPPEDSTASNIDTVRGHIGLILLTRWKNIQMKWPYRLIID